jgi:hypothetical protein
MLVVPMCFLSKHYIKWAYIDTFLVNVAESGYYDRVLVGSTHCLRALHGLMQWFKTDTYKHIHTLGTSAAMMS